MFNSFSIAFKVSPMVRKSAAANVSADVTPEQSEFQIDLQGLIKLLAKNLYAEADVFVREMLQNVHDSVKRRRELQGEGAPPGEVRVKVDRTAGTITFADNGAGMTEHEVKEYLSTIGRSGADAFRRDLVQKGRQTDVKVIGQFGIGLLSAFIVADQVVVETRSWQVGDSAWQWESAEKTTTFRWGVFERLLEEYDIYWTAQHCSALIKGLLYLRVLHLPVISMMITS
jgi:molecular chaperone HtpG